VDTVFGMAGTMTLELYRGIARTGIRHVQCRNEQGASLMADGYARATGKPGVCTIIGGPGVTNASTGICPGLLRLAADAGAVGSYSHGDSWQGLGCHA
jgi:thiamine pyrophosphate-dependent acetolactate synthase large subunit-like protein